MNPPLWEVTEDDGVVVARLHGEIDVVNVPAIGGALRESVHREAAGLAVDLSEVRYLDSAGIHMLFQLALHLATRRKGMAVAVGQDSPIATLLKITSFEDAASVLPSLAECVEALRSDDFLHY